MLYYRFSAVRCLFSVGLMLQSYIIKVCRARKYVRLEWLFHVFNNKKSDVP